MWPFLCWAVEYLGFAIVSVWCLLDHAARLVAVGVIARLAWRAKDDEDGEMDAVGQSNRKGGARNGDDVH